MKNTVITGSKVGIYLFNTSSDKVVNNTITGTRPPTRDSDTAGIYVNAESNEITGNNLINNSIGVHIYWGGKNTIYHNNFINNSQQAWDSHFDPFGRSYANSWDNGLPSGGNYWSDYKASYPDATQTGNSGSWNISYKIQSNDADNYPLIEPYTTSPPNASLLSPLNQTYIQHNVSLIFSLDRNANWIGYSLDGKQNVTITGNYTITSIPNGQHTITIYANDTYGNIGSQTINFAINKPEPFPTTMIAIIFVLVIIGLSIGLILLRKRRKTPNQV